ncbi:hypothetical protein [Breoghania sp.]|uniref:hypothetical protein n=1 Tax=Breoghania sp. TaxID=2065378 RepID=UPI0026284C1A|nr:hypothetical protein [Breoghania sp.]MDJ0929818.1 hypothetical protein [Breoghania sp.]
MAASVLVIGQADGRRDDNGMRAAIALFDLSEFLKLSGGVLVYRPWTKPLKNNHANDGSLN